MFQIFPGGLSMKNLKPDINVTPLIDVLLVLLIIFMVAAPLKPSDFKAKIPRVPAVPQTKPNPDTLVVSIKPDSSLHLNNVEAVGTTGDASPLTARLAGVFRERLKNGVFKENGNEVEKTVFVRAPRSLSYGEVVRVVDAVKTAGAEPIALEIDRLE
jgi:biopolymer transport protein ExbD